MSIAQFIAGADDYKKLPIIACPEFAFWGRSNVGKSSLVNSVLGIKGVARVSRHPGRTQQINLFYSQNKSFVIADLPGYGYAAVDKTTKLKLFDMALNYLLYRKNLASLFLLIDARHRCMDNDIKIIQILHESGVSFIKVFTKCDKKEALCSEDGIYTSSTSGKGIDLLHTYIKQYL